VRSCAERARGRGGRQDEEAAAVDLFAPFAVSESVFCYFAAGNRIFRPLRKDFRFGCEGALNLRDGETAPLELTMLAPRSFKFSGYNYLKNTRGILIGLDFSFMVSFCH
jgi:hypothetical protein